MAYILQAVLVKDPAALGSSLPSARVVPLQQGINLIPMTDDLFDEIQAALPGEGEAFPRFDKLSAAVARWARDLSATGPVAYIEAEYHGGQGVRSAVAWRQGEIVLGPVYSHDAINHALRLLGVEARGERDEFDAVGLGWHRDTDEWLTDIRE